MASDLLILKQGVISHGAFVTGATGDNHLLVQMSSSETTYRPGKIYSALNNIKMHLHRDYHGGFDGDCLHDC